MLELAKGNKKFAAIDRAIGQDSFKVRGDETCRSIWANPALACSKRLRKAQSHLLQSKLLKLLRNQYAAVQLSVELFNILYSIPPWHLCNEA